jgi:hypothetical protein
VSCCPVETDILRQAEHPPKESKCRHILFINFERRRFELSKNCTATGKKERKVKVKQSRYTPWRCLGGEEV